MSGVSVNLNGFAKLNARLTQLSKVEATKAAQIADRAGGAALRKAVIKAAPKSDVAEGAVRNRKTKRGTTRKEVHHKISNSIKVKKTKPDSTTKVQVSVLATSGAYQAFFVEYGSIHNAPNPFFRTAFDQNEPMIIEVMAKALEKQLIKRGV